MYLPACCSELKQAEVETAVFDRVQANPLRSTVMDGAAFAKENGCDFIVALGAGSGMGKTNEGLEKSCPGARLMAGKLLNGISETEMKT